MQRHLGCDSVFMYLGNRIDPSFIKTLYIFIVPAWAYSFCPVSVYLG